MRLGVHVSIAGGLPKAMERAAVLGCETVQIFAGNPRSWRSKPLSKPEIAEFRTEREKIGLGPVVVHMPYLANLAASEPGLLNKSIDMVREQLERCELLGAEYLVCHMGKADDEKAMDRMEKTVRKALGRRERACTFLLENTAGQGREMGFHLAEIGVLLDRLQRPDVGVCLDTCHAHAAGYDLSAPVGFRALKEDVVQYIDLTRLKVVHLNDALRPAGSRVDRHQHIGQGTIGLDGFKRFMKWTALRSLPGILETPKKTENDDTMNLAVLRSLQSRRRKSGKGTKS